MDISVLAYLWRSEDNLEDNLVFSSTLWVLGIQLGLSGLDSKHSYPLSHSGGSQQVLSKMHFLDSWDPGLHFLDDRHLEALSFYNQLPLKPAWPWTQK